MDWSTRRPALDGRRCSFTPSATFSVKRSFRERLRMPGSASQPEDSLAAGSAPFVDDDELFTSDCVGMVARLHHFLDGELTDSRRLVIQAHLDGCPSCFSAFDFEAELRIVVAHRVRTEVPATLMERVRQAISQENAGFRHWPE